MKNPPADMNAPVFRFMQALGYAEKPVVAAVNGAAVGIGTTMLMHCDLVYCADNSVFSMPFVSLGLCPEFASSLLIPLNAGYHKAVEKLLLAEPINASEALEMKIVNRVLPRDDVLDFAIKQAERFNQLPPASVRATKRLLRSGWKTVTEKGHRSTKPARSGRCCAAQRRKRLSRHSLNAGSRIFRSLLDRIRTTMPLRPEDTLENLNRAHRR